MTAVSGEERVDDPPSPVNSELERTDAIAGDGRRQARAPGEIFPLRDDPTRALAAYNAGASRVTRWSRRPGASDPEQFAEWIPFVETRDYVRAVLRNRAVYAALYGW